MKPRIFSYQGRFYSLDRTSDPNVTVLYALSPNCHDKRIQEQVDFDYVDILFKKTQSSNPSVANEAASALIFLNAASDSMYSGSHKKLESIQELTPEYKKSISSSRNAAQRDLFNQSNQKRTSTDQENIQALESTSSSKAISEKVAEAKAFRGRKKRK